MPPYNWFSQNLILNTSAILMIPTTHPVLAEGFADVKISLSGNHDDTVDAASESHLGHREDDGGDDGLDVGAEAG